MKVIQSFVAVLAMMTFVASEKSATKMPKKTKEVPAAPQGTIKTPKLKGSKTPKGTKFPKAKFPKAKIPKATKARPKAKTPKKSKNRPESQYTLMATFDLNFTIDINANELNSQDTIDIAAQVIEDGVQQFMPEGSNFNIISIGNSTDSSGRRLEISEGVPVKGEVIIETLCVADCSEEILNIQELANSSTVDLAQAVIDGGLLEAIEQQVAQTNNTQIQSVFANATIDEDSLTQGDPIANANTPAPTNVPSTSMIPSTVPSNAPSTTPSTGPSDHPSESPSSGPSTTPSAGPSVSPSESPSTVPSETPSVEPSMVPSTTPSAGPSVSPSASPSTSAGPSVSLSPSVEPSMVPSTLPSFSCRGDFTPIANTADAVKLSISDEDDVAEEIDLGFAFKWLGGANTISNVHITSNGQININPDDDMTEIYETEIGDYDMPRIAVANGDLNPSEYGAIWTKQTSLESMLISWEDVAFYCESDGSVNAQAELFANGAVRICFGDGEMGSGGDELIISGIEGGGSEDDEIFSGPEVVSPLPGLPFDDYGESTEYPPSRCYCFDPDTMEWY